MLHRIISEEIMGFMVGVLELASKAFWKGDRTAAYISFKKNGLWDIYINQYEVKCTLSKEGVLDEAEAILREKGEAYHRGAMDEETAQDLIRQIIRELAIRYNWSYTVTFDRFYRSKACADIKAGGDAAEAMDNFAKEWP